MKKKYDIYFHNDFDGRASAAVVLAFLRSRSDDIEHFIPVNFYLTEQWLDEKFFEKHKLFKGKRNPAIVVDFLYHPAATFWFDHHPTTFKKEIWRKKFKPDKFHHLDPSYPSNCHFTYTALKSDFGWKPEKHIKELIYWADIIDGAQYKTPQQTIEVKEPGLQIAAFVDMTDHDEEETVAIIKLLAEKPLSEIAKLKKVQRAAQETRRMNLKSLRYYKKHLRIFGDATFIDLTESDLKTLRYAPYYLKPKIMYAVRLTKKEGLYHLGIGANPWIKGAARKAHHDAHAGEILKKYGGGGHKGAGAVEFKTKAAAEHAVKEIVPLLNK
jgi:oligoribonuclease NrnB/cAMP/cGMP phosphodiesterase (DHH superfamily)